MTKSFRSNGKLLISGEYVVLKGATALAIPCELGQSLEVVESNSAHISWESYAGRDLFLKALFDLKGNIIESNDGELGKSLSSIFTEILRIKQKDKLSPARMVSNLEFPINWGLGSSSTLINNLADYHLVDPFELLSKTFGGSGYDIACAQSNSPLLYNLHDNVPSWEEVEFSPSFSDQIKFVYLNKKMNSREALKQFKKREDKLNQDMIDRISEIGRSLIDCREINEFSSLLDEHESILSEILGVEKVKDRLFGDYTHSIKSLGAWGGDFIMAIGDDDEMDYFRNRGYETILSFSEMVKKN